MRKGFTLIELMICIAIIAVIAAIAIPNLVESRSKTPYIRDGDVATVNATGLKVRVIDATGMRIRCRVDNGESALPRYSEVTFMRDELTRVMPATKVERE